ncbi:MAG: ATP-binding protein [Spirochaetes bacterium]|nr:ATP-binding protein [Spirochaetota bacterium]
MNESKRWGIDVTGRIMWYNPWPTDKDFNYCQPVELERNEIYINCGQALKETYLAFKEAGGNTNQLFEYLNNHTPAPHFLVNEEILLDCQRWYTNEFYFYFIMFTKKVLNDYNWCYSEETGKQLSEHHKIYEIGYLKYDPFGKTEKDVSNSVIITILQYIENQNINTADVYQWLDILASRQSTLIYSKDISALENYWICSEFIFYFYEFAKIITNINNMLTISYESVSAYSLRFFSYTPERVIIDALKMIINKSGKMFKIDITQRKSTELSVHIQRKKQFDYNKMHLYTKSINQVVNKIIPGVYLRTIKNFFNISSDPKVTFLTPTDGPDCSFSISWQKEHYTSSLSLLLLIMLPCIASLFIPMADFSWFKICIISFLVPYTAFIGLLYKYQKEMKTKKKLEKHLIQSNQENIKRLDQMEAVSEELIHEKVILEKKVIARVKELQEVNEKLQELDRIKTNFFDNISHELKTPLTLIASPLESIIKKQYGNSILYSNDIFQIMLNNCKRLIHLINMLLHYSKLEQGKMKLHKTLIDIISFVHSQFLLFEHQGLEKNIKTRFVCHIEHKVIASIDSTLFEMVIANLLSNAFKFSDHDNEVTIEMKEDKNKENIFIIVQDTGIGIPKDKQKFIFERFHQVESDITRKHEGTGLGLSLAKEIVELHKGKITVESAMNQGSKFTIKLPASQYNIQNTMIKNKLGSVTHIEKNFPIFDTKKKDTKPDIFIDQKTHLKKILLVEDNVDMSNYIVSILQSRYDVTTAKNGIEALNILKNTFTPDLIISDIMMPVMDGFTFLKQTCDLKNTPFIPFIFLTARGSLEEKIKGFRSGAIDYITKPFNLDILLARIETILINNEKRDNAIIDSMKAKVNAVLTDFSPNNNEINPAFHFPVLLKYNITKREKEIIQCVLTGQQDKEIASELKIATSTVSRHLANIYEKVGVANRLELITLLLKAY